MVHVLLTTRSSAVAEHPGSPGSASEPLSRGDGASSSPGKPPVAIRT